MQTNDQFLRLFPLRSVVLFPKMELPLIVFEPRYKQLTNECLANNEPFGVILLRSGEEVGVPTEIPFSIGTTARIKSIEELGDGRLRLLTLGEHRFHVIKFIHDYPYLSARVNFLPEDPGIDVAANLVDDIKQISTQYAQVLASIRGGYLRKIQLPNSPEDLSFLAAALLQGHGRLQQDLLETDNINERLTKAYESLLGVVEETKRQATKRWSNNGFGIN